MLEHIYLTDGEYEGVCESGSGPSALNQGFGSIPVDMPLPLLASLNVLSVLVFPSSKASVKLSVS